MRRGGHLSATCVCTASRAAKSASQEAVHKRRENGTQIEQPPPQAPYQVLHASKIGLASRMKMARK